MRRNYSRLESVEEKRNVKKAALFGLLTVAAILFLLTFGLPSFAKLAGFLLDLKKSNQKIEKFDNTPPAPPRLKVIPEFTNKSPIEVSGSSEQGSTILINLNNKEDEFLTDKDGNFVTKINLKKGENSYYLSAKDAAGNIGQKTPVYKITFDNEPPKIEITSPTEGSVFYGLKQQTVTVKGNTEPEADLTINDHFVTVNDDGTFTYEYPLSEGINSLTIKARDKAENVTETTLNLAFNP